MDFDKNNAGLDKIMSLYSAFLGSDNPDAQFSTFRMDPVQAARAFELTKEALGDKALDEVHGVLSGSQETGAVALLTGNSPTSPQRAELFALMLDNWGLFYSMMKAYVDVRQNGFILTFQPDPVTPNAGSWLAIGPGFLSLDESAHGVAETPEAALKALQAQSANEPLLGAEWSPEKRALGRATEWFYDRVKQGDDKPDLIRVTGRWTKPGTRLAVKYAKTISIATETEDMPFAKREIIENLWDNRERAGGKS